jgi:hypothetical protein
MSESHSSSQHDSVQPAPEQPIERPRWRFSGRRGTPVHLREQAPTTLPREIRQAIVQMAREHSAPQGVPQEQAPGTVQPGQAPPVAGAAVPVERRSERASAPDSVTTSPIAPPSAAVAAPPPTDAPADAQAPTDAAPELADAAAQASTPPAKPKNGPRPILAGDREVPRTEAIAIEPGPAGSESAATTLPPAIDQDQQAPDQLPAAAFASFPTDVPAAGVAGPGPMGAVELGRQAAWELGRLPILLHVEPQMPASRAPGHLEPTQWRSVDTTTQPAASIPTPEPAKRLSAQKFVARAREDSRSTPPPSERAAQARERASRRRRDLDQVVHALAGFTGSRTDSDDR